MARPYHTPIKPDSQVEVYRLKSSPEDKAIRTARIRGLAQDVAEERDKSRIRQYYQAIDLRRHRPIRVRGAA